MFKKIPIACTPTAMTEEQRERYKELKTEMAKSHQETVELSNGYAFRFPTETSQILQLAEFISLERLCCPFLNFELRVEAGDSVWLQLTGDEGTKGVLKENFSLV